MWIARRTFQKARVFSFSFPCGQVTWIDDRLTADISLNWQRGLLLVLHKRQFIWVLNSEIDHYFDAQSHYQNAFHLSGIQPRLYRHKDRVLLNDKSLLRLNHIWNQSQSQDHNRSFTNSRFKLGTFSIKKWVKKPFQSEWNLLPWRVLGSPLFGCCSPKTQHPQFYSPKTQHLFLI